ncbi:MAG: phenylalanine--tRNA ligase subunit beta [Cystobacterineae bacterium]|nr:phenylalanine--tRNA ligase subunit beta [Cystobacterineae bacterium]
MKVSLKWLSDYVHVPAELKAEALAERLTLAGLEVEGLSHTGAGLEAVVVAQVVSVEKHPNAEKLSVVKVDCGEGGPLQIVCGARNFKSGDKVPLAKEGAKLPNGMHISRAVVRGVESFGMLCSAKELGLSEDAEGLLLLEEALKVGEPLAKALELDDVVLEVNITPDRPDALSHLGIARDISALLSLPLQLPEAPCATPPQASASHPSGFGIEIAAKERCLRYAACLVEGLTVAPSPQWMRRRLAACGIRAINNLVDVTNYVLLEYGQPLHAFDVDKLPAKRMVVRLAREGEVLTTLDEKARVLSAEDLLICDGERPLALAGVMGGKDSEVSAQTRKVLLECAVFSPVHTRKTAKRHGLQTESSHRFERGVDISQVHMALKRAAKLLAQLGGGEIAGDIFEVYPEEKPQRVLPWRASKFRQVVGHEVEEAEAARILSALGFQKQGEGAYEVPSSRSDILHEEDLIAEVARIMGYAHIPSLPPRMLRPAQLPEALFWERKIRQLLCGMGLSEVLNYSFAQPSHVALLGEKAPVILQNPMSEEMSVLRTSLFPGLLHNIGRAKRHQAESAALFEVGRSYFPRAHSGGSGAPPALERHEVAGALWGLRTGKRTWTAAEESYGFFDMKGMVESLLKALKVEGVRFEPLEEAAYHPRASASVWAGEERIGSLGEVHPRVAKHMDVPSNVFLFQLELEKLKLCASKQPRKCALSEHPSVLRDLAVVLPRACSHERVVELMYKTGAPLLEEVQLFDIYLGKPIAETHKSFAFALRYSDPNRTLADGEVNEVHERIVEEISTVLGGKRRI